MQVEHRQGLLVQETHYDPAGLELAGLAAPSPGIRGLNNYRFNGKEFQADLGLAWNHQDWRFFDPQLLRWHAGDPEIENGQESWTPYAFGFNNAVRYADANGRCPNGCPPANKPSKPSLLDKVSEALDLPGLLHDLNETPLVGPEMEASSGLISLAKEVLTFVTSTSSNSQTESAGKTGVIYRRTNPETGKKYIGQAKSDERFDKRKQEHDKAKKVDHKYEVIERAEPGEKLDVAEEKHIRAEGGPATKSNPDGKLENKRHQMSDERYKKATGATATW